MKLTKTTINFAQARGLFVQIDDLTAYGDNVILTISSERDETTYLEYIVNVESGAFNFKFNLDLVPASVKEELPAYIRDEKHLREVLVFISENLLSGQCHDNK